MASALKTWRQERRASHFWDKARARSESLPPGEVLQNIDLAVMMAGAAISHYRNSVDPQARQDQLLELRMNLEAALGMLDNLIK
jgi:hypothetical protein